MSGHKNLLFTIKVGGFYYDFFCDYDSHEAMYAREQFEECILIFSSNEEKKI